MTFGRVSKREREAMIARLHALRTEHAGSPAKRIVDNYLLYAETGRDRKKLGMEWVERCESAIHAGSPAKRIIDSLMVEPKP